MNIEDISEYLPKYLSARSEKLLLSELNSFSEGSLFSPYATSFQEPETVYQGDSFSDIPFGSPFSKATKDTRVLVLSNTCDISENNARSYPSQVAYVPLLPLAEYCDTLLKNGKTPANVADHEREIKKQKVTQFLFLPATGGRLPDCIALLDRTCHAPVSLFSERLSAGKRITSFSNTGFYLFILKLSIHFTRIRESVDRIK